MFRNCDIDSLFIKAAAKVPPTRFAPYLLYDDVDNAVVGYVDSPKRFMEEPIKTGPSRDMVISRGMLDTMLDHYYEFRGWDKTTGIPTREKLLELSLDDVADDMEKFR